MYTMIDVKYTQEDFFMSAEFLDFILEVVISYLVPILRRNNADTRAGKYNTTANARSDNTFAIIRNITARDTADD